jgi:multimeric flavodoxin WrbA
MARRVVAINGTYRKGGITDQLVEEVLRAVRDRGGEA